MDLFHQEAIGRLIQESNDTVQQAKLTLAAANEVIQNVNRVVEKAEKMLDAVMTAGHAGPKA